MVVKLGEGTTPVNDLTGKRFGRLIVTEFRGSIRVGSQKKTRWLCICDCGGGKEVYTAHLTKGYTQSCGCLKQETNHARGSKSHKFKGVGLIPKSMWDRMVSRHRRSGDPRKEVKISMEYGWELFLKQGGRCALSGVEITFPPTYKQNKEGTASLDRIDSNRCYEEGNVQWLHKDVNHSKSDLEEGVFLEICRKVAGWGPKNFTE